MVITTMSCHTPTGGPSHIGSTSNDSSARSQSTGEDLDNPFIDTSAEIGRLSLAEPEIHNGTLSQKEFAGSVATLRVTSKLVKLGFILLLALSSTATAVGDRRHGGRNLQTAALYLMTIDVATPDLSDYFRILHASDTVNDWDCGDGRSRQFL